MLPSMILVTANPAQQLLYFKYVNKVTAAEMRARIDEIRGLLTSIKPGFRLLGDFENLDSMDEDCVAEIGQVMDLLKTNGIELVVRVIPDARKDIGLSILSVFHYGRSVRAVTCDTIDEALKLLKI
jgi:anti-anti-sigma regulatory factor